MRAFLAGLAHGHARLRAMEAALKFYADPVSWMWWASHPATKDERPALLDHGEKARAALGAGPGT